MEENVPVAEQPKFFGSKEVLVGKVALIDGVLWIDSNSNKSELGSSGFKTVDETVFRFELGGYQICEKWFKDRRGQCLSQVEIDHVRKMLGSISKIIKLQAEVDETVTSFGGFPDAFL
jgi:hypothetical protein